MITDLREKLKTLDLEGAIHVEIALCGRCEGAGRLKWVELVDYHKCLYKTTYYECKDCNSTGRIYKQTLNLTGFRPFKEAGDGN